MDIWDKKKRSEVMSKIPSKNTKPEIILRKALFAKGFRYRINYKKLPGKPDIVFPKYKIVIFVHGCFWHGHDIGCIDSHIPKTNTDYWVKKIAKNKERDKNNAIQILSMGWKILTVWDCEIQQRDNLKLLIEKIANTILESVASRKSMRIKLYEEVEGNLTMVAPKTISYQDKISE